MFYKVLDTFIVLGLCTLLAVDRLPTICFLLYAFTDTRRTADSTKYVLRNAATWQRAIIAVPLIVAVCVTIMIISTAPSSDWDKLIRPIPNTSGAIKMSVGALAGWRMCEVWSRRQIGFQSKICGDRVA
jgi:hypothetical protein